MQANIRPIVNTVIEIEDSDSLKSTDENFKNPVQTANRQVQNSYCFQDREPTIPAPRNPNYGLKQESFDKQSNSLDNFVDTANRLQKPNADMQKVNKVYKETAENHLQRSIQS